MSDTIETPLETLSINNDEGSTFNYVNNCLVKKFYEFMADVYIERQKKYEHYLKDLLNEKIVTTIQDFPQYFLYKLYYHYGVKRRMTNDHIALLYYSKTAKGYKNKEPITMLCRHMLLDLKCMRIISLGIPKAVKLDKFCDTYSINKSDASTNYIKKEDKTTDDKTNKYDMYYFSEGTMMTYNPSLSKYNFTFVECDDSDDEDEPKTKTEPKTDTKTEAEAEAEPKIEPKTEPKTEVETEVETEAALLEKSLDIEKPVEIKFVNQFIYSTRKILGTGHFNSYKSFLQMFLENNLINKIDLNKIPEEYIKDTVLVFNIEHPDNNIISTIKRNSNILCGVFKFKNEEQSNQEFEKITTITYSLENESDIKKHFEVLGHTMVTQIKVKDFKQQLYDNNIKINLQLPKLIKYFEKSTSEKSSDDKEDKSNDLKKDKEIHVNTFSLEQLEYIVDNKSKFFHGYIIYGKNGERTKIANKKYKDLCELKGNKPINLEQCNIKNLFYLYIRLIKQNTVQKFLKEFDSENTNTITTTQPLSLQFTLTSYKQIFMWFYSLVNNYAIKLFKVYHYSFVKKTFEKKNIPFSLKPMCGDLHTLYKSNSVPITKSFIEQYLVEQTAYKLYWRLFDNTKDETITINE